jgi:hypothetical protein
MFVKLERQFKNSLCRGVLAASLGLAAAAGLLAPAPAEALTYVPLVEGPGKAMASGPVDIDVFYSVRDAKSGKVQWLKHTLTNQTDIGPANGLIQRLLKEGHQVTIGWRRKGK